MSLCASAADSRRAAVAPGGALRCLPGVLCAALLLGGCTRSAEQSPIPQAAVDVQPGRRLALLIGNDSYQHAEVLRNARADARAVAASLQSLGFTVSLKQDLGLEQMKEALRNFKESIAGGDEVVFYFSGHGVQLGGTNYLIPVTLDPTSEGQVIDDSIALQRVLDDLGEQKPRFSLAIVDACRDDPFKGSGRAIAKRGLAMQSASGQMVMYSAGTGQEALDRLGPNDRDPNGLFTRVFIKEVKKPGVTANQLLKNVLYQVVQLAKGVGHDQVPALYDQTIGDYYFVRVAAGTALPATPAAAPAADTASVHVESADEVEQEYWDRIRDSKDPADFADYQKQFPQGLHAPEAALEMRRLTRLQRASSAPATISANAAARPVARAPVVPVAATSSLPVPAGGTAQPSGTAITPGVYGGWTTQNPYPDRAFGKLMLRADGYFEFINENGARLRGSLNLSHPEGITGRATVVMSNGNYTGVDIHNGRIVSGQFHAEYTDGWNDSGEIVIDLSHPQ
jgi:hypothetical protein